jgi:hypothetical protein
MAAKHTKGSGGPAGSVAAKRAGSRIAQLKKRAEAGEDVSGRRGYLRLGVNNTAIMTGQEDLSSWDEEELLRGQKKDKNGRFQGRAPKVVPIAIHDELVKRTLNEAKELMRTALVPACTMLAEIIADTDASDKDKLTAATMIIDRMMGKSPERIEVSGNTPPWLVAITDGIVSLDDEDEPIEAESWEDDDTDND